MGRDLGTFFLPGSKRLITEHGIFGNNLDVLTPEELPHAQGYCGSWSGGSSREGSEAELALVELILDFVILDDGLCLGPDESGLYETLDESLDLQSTASQEAVRALQAGASIGKVFEIIRPLVRQSQPPPQTQGAPRHPRRIVQIFGHEAIHQLIEANDTDLLSFFTRAAEPRSLELRRPK